MAKNNTWYVVLLYWLSTLQLKTLYGLSDYVLYPLVHLFYRRKLVRKNLSLAFPDKSEAERREIERKFYHWFCDLAVETIKVHSISREEIVERFAWPNVREVEEATIGVGKDFACCYLSHYCNWEMAVGLPFSLSQAGMCQIYHPLKNDAMDEWFVVNRGQFGAENIKMKDTLRRLLTLRKEAKEGSKQLPNGQTIRGWLFGCIADQLPKRENIHLRLPFLNQDTGVFSGSERLARKLGMTVWYCHITMPSRGHYECHFSPIEVSEEELKADEFAYTRRYFALLEEQIKERPELWLWTHDRWKR